MSLIIVPTPIGNLEDMTLRGLRALREADFIACEDTRHTLRLLNHFGIKKPLMSCHEHNENERAETIIDCVENGEDVALVSDAGTPGLSDPGCAVISAAISRGVDYDVLPGANALLPALMLSGLDMTSFTFVGFLKGRTSEKKKKLEQIAKHRETLVFYIAPHAIIKELEFIASVLGDRRAVLVREISKIHQETITGTLMSFSVLLPEEKIRGEFVCVVEGTEGLEELDSSVWMEEAKEMRASGSSVKDIADVMYTKYHVQRNSVKHYILENLSEGAK